MAPASSMTKPVDRKTTLSIFTLCDPPFKRNSAKRQGCRTPLSHTATGDQVQLSLLRWPPFRRPARWHDRAPRAASASACCSYSEVSAAGKALDIFFWRACVRLEVERSALTRGKYTRDRCWNLHEG